MTFILMLFPARALRIPRMSPALAHPKRVAIQPIQFVHMPKCGSSFETTIAHSVCDPHQVPENFEIKGPTSLPASCRLDKERFSRFDPGHAPFNSSISGLEHVVTMFRSPKQRIISGYYARAHLHDCQEMQEVEGGSLSGKSNEFMFDYAKCVERCQSNMLMGRMCSSNVHDSKTVVAGAIARLPNVGFFGLTEHWELSVCLWHAKFGGDCIPASFNNNRPGNYTHDETVNWATVWQLGDTVFGDWEPADQKFYDAAKSLFFKETKKYGVDRISCAKKYCPKMANRFVPVASDGGEDFLKSESCQSVDDCDWPGRLSYDED